MKMTVVFPVLNQHPLARNAIAAAIENLSGKHEVNIAVLDCGSDEEFQFLYDHPHTITRMENEGVYPLFWHGLNAGLARDSEIVAFFHSDLFIVERNWDERVISLFESNERIGLVGFIGSDEIDSSGGRGSGTTSNFQGRDYGDWKGSPASVHGRTYEGFTRAAVVDGCAMIFRRSVLKQIQQRKDFPPHHFYDRLLSCEVREHGFEVYVLGIACDHISGQTVNQEKKYDDMARTWAEAHGFTMEGVHNWDSVLYREAERQWLTEYREKGLVPAKVWQ